MKTILKIGLGIVLGCTIVGCGDDAPASDLSSAGGERVVQASQARAWPERWCALSLGMTRQQVLAGMKDPPTQEYTLENTPAGFEPQAGWDALGYQMIAFFDIEDRVRQLYVNEVGLSDAQRETIKCELVRAENDGP